MIVIRIIISLSLLFYIVNILHADMSACKMVRYRENFVETFYTYAFFLEKYSVQVVWSGNKPDNSLCIPDILLYLLKKVI